MSYVIYKPRNAHSNPKYKHAGDTFRELIDLWKAAGYVTVKEIDGQNPESGLIWMVNVSPSTSLITPLTLLYDRPTLEWLPSDIEYAQGLFANPDPPLNKYNNHNWIFWGRHPKMLEEFSNSNILSYDERSISSIFVGNIENSVQEQYRTLKNMPDWSTVITHFTIVKSHQHAYTPMDYLKLISKSRFGLALRGYGPKCNREIELMALGVVPLLTDSVSINYYDPLIENLHFIRVQTTDDVLKAHNMPKWKWEIMSEACRKWYLRNSSTEGSFRTTKHIIERNCVPETIAVATMATEQAWDDLKLMLFSLYQFHKNNVEVFIVGDDFVLNNIGEFIQTNTPELRYKCINCLQQYAGMDRRTMEQWGLWLDFMLRKCDAINLAFEHKYENVLFVDCDMVFLNEIALTEFDLSKDIGRSPHLNLLQNQQRYGVYNGGFLWINHRGFTDWWSFMSREPHSRYYEQAILEDASKYFTTFDVPIQYNYGWWRLYECDPQLISKRESSFRVVDGSIQYDQKPLRTIHTHFGEKLFYHTIRFNQFILKLLVAAKNPKQINILQFIKKTFYENQIKDLNIIKHNITDPTMSAPISSPISSPVSSPIITTTNNKIDEGKHDERKHDERKHDEGKHDEGKNTNLSETMTEKTKNAQIHLVVQYYNDSNPERQDEIDYCFQANLLNPNIVKLHNLHEPNTQIPDWLKNDPKYVSYPVSEWLDYNSVFEYANNNLPPGSAVCLCNADIFLDHNSKWNDAQQMLEFSLVFCQSRYEFDGEQGASKDETLQKIAYANAQDAWLFKTPFFVRDCAFKMGKLGSDNAIADRIKISGYIPVNSPNQFKIYHYDKCRGKTGQNYLQIQKPNPEHPEHRGYYLLPDIDSIKSVDRLIETLGLGSIHKYRAICDIMSKYIELKNP